MKRLFVMLLQIGLLQACPIEAQTTYLPLLEPNKEWYNALMFNYDSGVFLADTRFCTEYEQLIGGVETLFKDSASIVEGYANDAYKTAGLSANDYMQTVTSFSASLLQSLDQV